MKPQTKLAILIVVFSLGLAIMLNSCKTAGKLQTTTHETTQSNTVASVDENHTQTQNQQLTAQQSSTQQSIQQNDVNEATDQHVTWYDTSKPVDPITGKPPVSCESTTTHNKVDKSKADSVNSGQVLVNENSDNQVNNNKKSSLSDKTKTKVDEKVKSNYSSKFNLYLPWWIYLIIISVIIGLLYRFCLPFRVFADKIIAIVKSKWKKK